MRSKLLPANFVWTYLQHIRQGLKGTTALTDILLPANILRYYAA